MKKRKLLLLPILYVCISNYCTAQSLQYDTTLAGSGNGYYNLSFPKFDPALGTLTAVEITTDVSLQYSFTLENKETIAISNYRVRIVREDEISGTAIQVPQTSYDQQTFGNYSLSATDGVPGSGSDYMSAGPIAAFNHTTNAYTLYNTADYMGIGYVTINYAPMTYTIVFGGSTYAFGGNSTDETVFSITYHYTPVTPLNAGIIFFSARKNNNAIDLEWITKNETNDRFYELQKSIDGGNFMGVARIPAKANANATGAYTYPYTLRPADHSKLTFRIKQVDNNGTVSYSPVRVIDMNTSDEAKPRLFPNPSKGSSFLLFSNSNRNDWQVEVYAANGQLVRRYFFKSALVGKLNAQNDLPKGLYFVKAINKNSTETFINRLLIQ